MIKNKRKYALISRAILLPIEDQTFSLVILTWPEVAKSILFKILRLPICTMKFEAFAITRS